MFNVPRSFVRWFRAVRANSRFHVNEDNLKTATAGSADCLSTHEIIAPKKLMIFPFGFGQRLAIVVLYFNLS